MKKKHLLTRVPTDKSPLAFSDPVRARRRRMWPLATAAAAMGLAGCGSFSWPGAAQDAPVISTPSQQEIAAERVKQFSSNIDIALDQVDRERLRAAAEKKNQAASAAALSGQAPVLFASSNNAAGPEPAPKAATPAGPALGPDSATIPLPTQPPVPAKVVAAVNPANTSIAGETSAVVDPQAGRRDSQYQSLAYHSFRQTSHSHAGACRSRRSRQPHHSTAGIALYRDGGNVTGRPNFTPG